MLAGLSTIQWQGNHGGKPPGGVPFTTMAGEQVVAAQRADAGDMDGLGRNTGAKEPPPDDLPP
jgi:hypothetical protein